VSERDSGNQRIADQIRQLRKALGLNQQAFALKTGFTQTAISKWEGGKARPTPEAFSRLAQLATNKEERNVFLAHAGIPEGFFAGGNSIPMIEPRVPPFDAELLAFVIVTVNRKLKQMNRKFTDDRKYAALVVAFYELCHSTRQRNPDMVDQLLKIA
jgi:transcriptional regulator with XRE-family HTH domain